eukprot:770807-Prymnesium_polylepis.1
MRDAVNEAVGAAPAHERLIEPNAKRRRPFEIARDEQVARSVEGDAIALVSLNAAHPHRPVDHATVAHMRHEDIGVARA